MNIFIGWDDREVPAYFACKKSIIANSTIPTIIKRLELSDLKDLKAYYRQDIYPTEKASTQFAFSRFLVPYLMNYQGWAIFCDCDFIWTGDISELFSLADEKYAVMCVKHDYVPKTDIKMDGQKQTVYPKKNWSSMMLFNCAHLDCKNLTVEAVNTQSGAWLHQMQWAQEEHIGELPTTWNFLVGEYDKPEIMPKVLHYTLGCPFMTGYENCDYADEYWKYNT